MKVGGAGGPQLLSAKDYAVSRIRAMIHAGTLGPDEKVAIEALATQLGVSRTPVRDALWQLQTEGLVTVSSRVGVFVRRITAAEAADIYRILQVVEPLKARWAAERAPAGERRGYRQMVRGLEEAAARDDTEAYIERLEACRAELVRLSQSLPMADVVGIIAGRVRLLRFRNLSQPGRLQTSASQHARVAEAIAAGDGDAAFSLMEEHMRTAASRVASLLAADTAEAPGEVDVADMVIAEGEGRSIDPAELDVAE